MSNRENYGQKALCCLHAAHTVRGSGERLALLSLAGNYMALAGYVGGRENRLDTTGASRRVSPGADDASLASPRVDHKRTQRRKFSVKQDATGTCSMGA